MSFCLVGFEIESRRWRGAPEFGLFFSRRGILWTWRHRQGFIRIY